MTDIYDMSHHNDVIRTVGYDKVNTLSAHMGTGGDNVQLVHTYCLSGNTIGREPKNGGNGTGVQSDISYTLDTIDRHAVCAENGQTNQPDEPARIERGRWQNQLYAGTAECHAGIWTHPPTHSA